jgi:hypothetical protein
VAVAQLLMALDSGLLANALNMRFEAEPDIHIIHCEGSFKRFPEYPEEKVYINRFDNIMNVLRTGGTDAAATYKIFGKNERPLMDRRWRSFSAIGEGAPLMLPIFHVDIEKYVRFVSASKKKAMTDQSLGEHIFYSLYTDCGNGFTCYQRERGHQNVRETVLWYSKPDDSAVVIILDPKGTPLKNVKTHIFRGANARPDVSHTGKIKRSIWKPKW